MGLDSTVGVTRGVLARSLANLGALGIMLMALMVVFSFFLISSVGVARNFLEFGSVFQDGVHLVQIFLFWEDDNV